MTRCQSCGAGNPEGSQYCDECGTRLNLPTEESRKIEAVNFKSNASDQPVFVSSNATSIGIPASSFEPKASAEPFDVTANKGENARARLVVERGELVGTEFLVDADEAYIGRWDADNGIFPDIDLDRHDPEAKISRRHARIVRRDGKFLIEDLGSTNGTLVNRGKRLIPGNKNVINDGDEIIIGKTFLRFRVRV